MNMLGKVCVCVWGGGGGGGGYAKIIKKWRMSGHVQ